MKKNIISFRTKAEVLLVSVLLLTIFMSSVIGTITETDTQTTTTDSELILHHSEGWINTWNITIDNNSVDNTVINTWLGEAIFNASDGSNYQDEWADVWNMSAPSHNRIVNSNNNSWTPTVGNIQLAINDLNNSNYCGWVKIPQGVYIIPTGEPIKTYNLTIRLSGAGGRYEQSDADTFGTVLRGVWNGGVFSDYMIEVGGKSTIYASPTKNVIIEDMVITGLSNSGLKWGGAIKLNNTRNCVIRNVDIGYFTSSTLHVCGINITGNGGVNSYYNKIVDCEFYRVPISIMIHNSSNANVVEGGVISSGINIAGDFPIGIWIVDSSSCWIKNIDIENFDYGNGVVMESNLIAWQGANNQFIGARFEGNQRDVYVKNGGGNNKFTNCRSSSVNEDFIDDGTNPSQFLNCDGMNYSYVEFGDNGDNHININTTGTVNFTGIAHINIPTRIEKPTYDHGEIEYYDLNNTLRIYNATTSRWYYYEPLGGI